MDGQHSANTIERWQSMDVCRLSGFEQSKPEMLLKIKEEVKKQLDAGFLEVSKYPQWVANIVPIPKKRWQITDVCRLLGF